MQYKFLNKLLTTSLVALLSLTTYTEATPIKSNTQTLKKAPLKARLAAQNLNNQKTVTRTTDKLDKKVGPKKENQPSLQAHASVPLKTLRRSILQRLKTKAARHPTVNQKVTLTHSKLHKKPTLSQRQKRLAHVHLNHIKASTPTAQIRQAQHKNMKATQPSKLHSKTVKPQEISDTRTSVDIKYDSMVQNHRLNSLKETARLARQEEERLTKEAPNVIANTRKVREATEARLAQMKASISQLEVIRAESVRLNTVAAQASQTVVEARNRLNTQDSQAQTQRTRLETDHATLKTQHTNAQARATATATQLTQAQENLEIAATSNPLLINNRTTATTKLTTATTALTLAQNNLSAIPTAEILNNDRIHLEEQHNLAQHALTDAINTVNAIPAQTDLDRDRDDLIARHTTAEDNLRIATTALEDARRDLGSDDDLTDRLTPLNTAFETARQNLNIAQEAFDREARPENVIMDNLNNTRTALKANKQELQRHFEEADRAHKVAPSGKTLGTWVSNRAHANEKARLKEARDELKRNLDTATTEWSNAKQKVIDQEHLITQRDNLKNTLNDNADLLENAKIALNNAETAQPESDLNSQKTRLETDRNDAVRELGIATTALGPIDIQANLNTHKTNLTAARNKAIYDLEFAENALFFINSAAILNHEKAEQETAKTNAEEKIKDINTALDERAKLTAEIAAKETARKEAVAERVVAENALNKLASMIEGESTNLLKSRKTRLEQNQVNAENARKAAETTLTDLRTTESDDDLNHRKTEQETAKTNAKTEIRKIQDDLLKRINLNFEIANKETARNEAEAARVATETNLNALRALQSDDDLNNKRIKQEQNKAKAEAKIVEIEDDLTKQITLTNEIAEQAKLQDEATEAKIATINALKLIHTTKDELNTLKTEQETAKTNAEATIIEIDKALKERTRLTAEINDIDKMQDKLDHQKRQNTFDLDCMTKSKASLEIQQPKIHKNITKIEQELKNTQDKYSTSSYFTFNVNNKLKAKIKNSQNDLSKANNDLKKIQKEIENTTAEIVRLNNEIITGIEWYNKLEDEQKNPAQTALYNLRALESDDDLNKRKTTQKTAKTNAEEKIVEIEADLTKRITLTNEIVDKAKLRKKAETARLRAQKTLTDMLTEDELNDLKAKEIEAKNKAEFKIEIIKNSLNERTLLIAKITAQEAARKEAEDARVVAEANLTTLRAPDDLRHCEAEQETAKTKAEEKIADIDVALKERTLLTAKITDKARLRDEQDLEITNVANEFAKRTELENEIKNSNLKAAEATTAREEANNSLSRLDPEVELNDRKAVQETAKTNAEEKIVEINLALLQRTHWEDTITDQITARETALHNITATDDLLAKRARLEDEIARLTTVRTEKNSAIDAVDLKLSDREDLKKEVSRLTDIHTTNEDKLKRAEEAVTHNIDLTTHLNNCKASYNSAVEALRLARQAVEDRQNLLDSAGEKQTLKAQAEDKMNKAVDEAANRAHVATAKEEIQAARNNEMINIEEQLRVKNEAIANRSTLAALLLTRTTAHNEARIQLQAAEHAINTAPAHASLVAARNALAIAEAQGRNALLVAQTALNNKEAEINALPASNRDTLKSALSAAEAQEQAACTAAQNAKTKVATQEALVAPLKAAATSALAEEECVTRETQSQIAAARQKREAAEAELAKFAPSASKTSVKPHKTQQEETFILRAPRHTSVQQTREETY